MNTDEHGYRILAKRLECGSLLPLFARWQPSPRKPFPSESAGKPDALQRLRHEDRIRVYPWSSVVNSFEFWI